MKILLILPNDLAFPDGQRWSDKNKASDYVPTRRYAYAPITLTTLAALVPAEVNAEVEIIDEGVQELPEEVQADLVGISTTTANAPRAYRIADRARARGMTVVLGGWHPTALPSEAMEHADAVVAGYAERAWPQLVLDFKNHRMKRFYEEPWEDVFENAMPFARRDLLKKKAYLMPNTFEATRGCLNKCHFCVVPGVAKGKFSARPVDQVVEEIRQGKQKKIGFVDHSPTEDLAYVKELYEALIPLGITWYGNTTTKIAEDDEWFDLAVKSGCKGLLFGFESLSQDALIENSKGFNKVRGYEALIKKAHDRNLSILACFVFGFDGDDRNIFQKTYDFVNETSIELCQYAVFTPFPGSPAFDRMRDEGRIVTTDWSLYDGKNVVFEPRGMTADELQNGFYSIWKKTYSYPSIVRRAFGEWVSPFPVLVANLGFRFFTRAFVPQ
jgi:radical SAM superfamily enzyme YgiQ (UPF0313 family)